jgi:hypothetical protein
MGLSKVYRGVSVMMGICLCHQITTHTMMQNYVVTFSHTTFFVHAHTAPKGAICRQAPLEVHPWLQRHWHNTVCGGSLACWQLGALACRLGLGHDWT